MKKAIEEIRRINEGRKLEAEQERLRKVICPDCGAELRIESLHELPDDIKVVFVKHN